MSLLDSETPPEGKALADALRLGQLKSAVLNGANANTNIALAGAAVGDRIVSCVEYVAGVPTTDRTAATSVTSAGNIQCTASTAGNKLVVLWADVT